MHATARGRRTGILALAAMLMATVVPAVLTGGPSAAVGITHSLVVSGSQVGMFPAFDPGIGRYAITTGAGTGGTVTVTAGTSDPTGVVRVNGRVAPGGTRTLTGLAPGEEISVFVTDSAGTARHSLIYLPSGFPTLARDTTESEDTPTPGHVLLTLALWLEPSPFFETAVDVNGVPAMVSQHANAIDLKRQPNGHYSVARGDGTPAGAEIVELDDQFREIASYRTVGLANTDGHDSILLPDGSRYLMAYEPSGTGLTDAIVQHVSADGDVLFQWNSADHVDPAAETVLDGSPDYAHINSIDLMDDGDLLLSFRHLSSVFKVARTAHDGFDEGDVVWRLGGRRSDFTFVNPDGSAAVGPCAQHTATQLDNGQIMVFDNGAWAPNPLCVDPEDPDGPVVPRLPTRIAAWSLDEDTGVATAVRDHMVGDRYALFAGSAQELPDGHVLIGWASSTTAVASEIDADGTLLWDLRTVGSPKYFTYRAFKQDVPDMIDPEVRVTWPENGATVAAGSQALADFECTDRGGSSLWTCAATPLDTRTPGTRTVTVTATDGAGNRRQVTRTYQVVGSVPTATPTPTPSPPPPVKAARPDAWIKLPGGTFKGQDTFGPTGQTVRATAGPGERVVAVVRVQNDGERPGRFHVAAPASTQDLAVSLRLPGGSLRSPRLEPGESWTFRVRILVRPAATKGDLAPVRIRVRSSGEQPLTDAVRVRVRVPGP